jgi:hypothetical protein
MAISLDSGAPEGRIALQRLLRLSAANLGGASSSLTEVNHVVRELVDEVNAGAIGGLAWFTLLAGSLGSLYAHTLSDGGALSPDEVLRVLEQTLDEGLGHEHS